MIPVYEERIMSDLFSSTNNPSYGLPTLPESETDWLTVEIKHVSLKMPSTALEH